MSGILVKMQGIEDEYYELLKKKEELLSKTGNVNNEQ
jgi:hypothetical protein